MLLIFLILSLMICVYLGFCVETNEYTNLGKIKIMLITTIKKIFSFLPQNIRNFLSSIYIYVIFKPNPIIQIIYLTLILVMFCVYVLYGVDVLMPNNYLSMEHVYIGYGLLILCLISFLYSCAVNPGYITNKNIQYYQKRYNKETILFEKGECVTCKLQKIPRGKHCNICNRCVSKFDHHCVWINQCVGAKNYKFFLLFISSHAILCTYSAILGFIMLYSFIIENNLLNVKFLNKMTNEVIENSYFTVMKYVINKNYLFFSTNVMLIVIGVTLVLFTLYHVCLVRSNLTSYEKSKRGRMINIMRLVIKTLKSLGEYKNFKIDLDKVKENDVLLKADDIVKYKDIVFKSKRYVKKLF